MNSLIPQITLFLSKHPIFGELPPTAIAALAQRVRPVRYPMGEVIFRKDEELPYIVILYQGQARTLGFNPCNQQFVTLEIVGPGSILGWVNLARGIGCETAIASTEIIGLMVDEGDFQEYLEQYPSLQAELCDRCALVELFELMGYQLTQQAQGETDLKALAALALEETQIYYLPPGESLYAEHPHLHNPQQSWLISSGGKIPNCPVGSCLRFQPWQHIEVEGTEPVRLVGVPAVQLAVEERQLAEVAMGEGTAPGTMVPSKQSYLIPEVEFIANYQEIPRELRRTNLPRNYPYVQGNNPLQIGIACFQMLSLYFHIPFRREVIQRILVEQLKRHSHLSLMGCGIIAELMELNPQQMTVPGYVFPRLHTPFLIHWQGSLAIVYEITRHNLILGVPQQGILHWPLADLPEDWQESEQEVLLLSPPRHTPREHFDLRWFLPSVVRYRRVLIEVLIASFFVQLFALANPLMIQVIIDKVIIQNSAATLQVLGVFLLIVAIFEALLSALRTYLFTDTSNRIDMSLGSEMIDHLLRLPLSYFEKQPVGEIATRINELERVRRFLTGTALTVVLDAVFSIIYLGVMIVYSPLLTLVSLSIIPLFMGLTLLVSPIIRRQLRLKAQRHAETQSHLVEVLSGVQTVKAQNIENQLREEWQERYARYVTTGFRTVITSNLANAGTQFLNKVSGLLVIWVGAYLVLEGELTLGALIAFRIIAGYVTSPILRLSQLWQNFQETALSLERLADIADTPQESERDRRNIPMPLIQGAVKYQGVSFRFQSYGPWQLQDINLELAPGTFTAIIGSSGAGKSTLTKLLSRLYEPDSGAIFIDGYDIGKVEIYSLRRQIGVVLQNSLLFEGTIWDNIALANPEASSEEIIEAAQVAEAHEFIMNLPNGYDTKVGERGATLSGGQRQRIAIARTVLQKPRLLVLDEATSALDYETEQKVFKNLSQAFRDCTVFFVTHRLNSVQSADVIVMLEAGQIVEQGTHGDLMRRKKHYYALYNKQKSMKRVSQ
ncbi:toxin secretion ABC transporter ATP-binding protein [Crocosphaera subtropica ATCC 51142]|uniref:Toxin secretion ABC transporter ATP-binding protein n=1 Tax=Crocosphaera subtropica (strain ATCC 51142 / BH68) TaxID=43989 RepID=B1WWT9_CROS5|nr:peptidase domain-containing ABC transporter [Crocosphaera subtropica]ACB52408.1 toxin secretion ABC transporter ATP-binding protein [Crocosphaera subtropica ATCC 51142]